MPYQSIRRRTISTPKPRPCIVQAVINLCSQGKLQEACNALDLVSAQGFRLDSQTLAFLLKQCASSNSLKHGKWVHLHLKLTGFKRPNTFVSNHLINMYAKCGSEVGARKVFDKMSMRNLFTWNNMLAGYAKMGKINDARKLFDKMPHRDVVTWNTMVIMFAKNGFFEDVFGFYSQFRRREIGVNEFSFAGVLIACVKLEDLGITRQVHGQVVVEGFLKNVVLSSSLVDAYAKCGVISDARKLFDEMPVRDVLAWTTLVSGYAKLGDVESARSLFDKMPEKNPVSWTALIGGYVRSGIGYEALELFTEMMMRGIRPDQFTFSSSLCACASIASLKHGKQIHSRLIRTGFKPNTIVVSSLIDMYSKCGSLVVGRRVFDLMGNKQDVVLWNTMLSALAQHGLGDESVEMFDNMLKVGTKPDRVTLVVILNACSHSGLVEEGFRLFRCMTQDLGIKASQEHYACLVDLFGRAGQFDAVKELLEKMPFRPDCSVWNAVLGTCRTHRNIELGKYAAEQLIEMEPQDSAPYVLLSNIYASLGRWESVQKVRHIMNERRVKKEQAISWVEVESKVHSFTVFDRLHPLKDEIYLVLEQLAGEMEDETFITGDYRVWIFPQ